MKSKNPPPTAYKPGQSGNPAGKPKGARNHATRALLNMMEGEALSITSAVIEAAKGGDMAAARFVLERIVPAAKERSLSLALPDVTSVSDVAQAQTCILRAVADGDITPGEGSTVAAIVESRRKTLETVELERRIAALEARK